MKPSELAEYLAAFRAADVMSAHLVLPTGASLSITLGPAMPVETAAPLPGRWKTEASDPHDPDPLQLGSLDAPMTFDEAEVAL